MKKDYIYIKICNDMNLCGIKVILKDKCNKIVFNGITDKFGKVKIPICNNEVYKLFVYSSLRLLIVPLIAKKGRVYCIKIDSNFIIKKNHLITVLLNDANYPNLKIKRGEIILWEDKQFK